MSGPTASFNTTKNSINSKNITYLSQIQSFRAEIQRFSCFSANLELYCVFQPDFALIIGKIERRLSFKGGFCLETIIFKENTGFIIMYFVLSAY